MTTPAPCLVVTRSGGTKPARLGPIVLHHLDPQVGIGADITAPWGRSVSYSGLASRAAAEQLNELVANPAEPVTIAGFTGALLKVQRDPADALPAFDGWHLLTACSVSSTWVFMAGGSEGLLPFTLGGILLSAALTPVYIRSARQRPNTVGLAARATVAAVGGFVQSTGGGPTFTRECDGSRFGETPMPALISISPGSLGSADAMSTVVLPADAGELDTPGVRPCGYDRRSGREVYSPSHPFVATTDAMIENGLLRLWCGPAGLVPYVSVAAIVDGVWQEVGNLAFSDEGDALLDVRITRCSADEVSLSLTVRRLGRVTLSLRKAERLVRVDYGSTRPNTPILTRPVRWLGMPPARSIGAASATTTARFGAGVALTTGGQIGFAWPPAVASSSWAYALNWTPDSAGSAQPDSGLWSVWADGSAVGVLQWDATTKTIRWTQGADTVSTAALTFSAGDDVFVGVAFDDVLGTVVATSVNGAAAVAVSDAAAVDPGAETFDSHWIGATGTGFGIGAFGSGPFGGDPVTADLGGAVSNAMLFDAALTSAELGALATATTRDGGLPEPLSRLVAYFPFAARPLPVASNLAAARRYETTTAGGTTRAPDDAGLTKCLGVLDIEPASSPPGTGFAVAATGRQFLAGAWLATTATDDDITDHHAELLAANRVQLSALQEG